MKYARDVNCLPCPPLTALLVSVKVVATLAGPAARCDHRTREFRHRPTRASRSSRSDFTVADDLLREDNAWVDDADPTLLDRVGDELMYPTVPARGPQRSLQLAAGGCGGGRKRRGKYWA